MTGENSSASPVVRRSPAGGYARRGGGRGEHGVKDRRRRRRGRDGASAKIERRAALLRSGQKRFIGFVMTGRHPCSPREVTLSALPAAAYRAGRDIFSIIPRERRVARVLAFGSGEGELLMLLSRFFCIARTSRPRRGTPRECSPLSKRRADCGVFYVPLSQRVFCERAERGTRLEKKSGTRKKRRPPTRAKPPDVTLGSVERW